MSNIRKRSSYRRYRKSRSLGLRGVRGSGYSGYGDRGSSPGGYGSYGGSYGGRTASGGYEKSGYAGRNYGRKSRGNSSSYGGHGRRIFNTIAWSASLVMVLNMLPAGNPISDKINELTKNIPAFSLNFDELKNGPESKSVSAEPSDTSNENDGDSSEENKLISSEKDGSGGGLTADGLKFLQGEGSNEGDASNFGNIVLTSLKSSQPAASSDIQIVEGTAEHKISETVGSGDILIYHTHATEAYQPVSAQSTHTTELAGTVREAGNNLEKALTEKGFNVIHDSTLHDSPSYNKSYNRSLETAKSLVAKYPDAKLVMDLHRDAASAASGKAKTVVINGEKVSSFCLVVGTRNDNYTKLRKLAEKIVNKANDMYPGFATGIVEKPYKFNGYLSDNCILLELGNNENTIDQINAATVYLADVFANVLG